MRKQKHREDNESGQHRPNLCFERDRVRTIPDAFASIDQRHLNKRPASEHAEEDEGTIVAIGQEVADRPDHETCQLRMPDKALNVGFRMRQTEQEESNEDEGTGDGWPP